MNTSFPKNLKKILADRRLSHKEISSHTGIPASTLSQWLSSKRSPRVDDSLVKLARYLGVSIDFLITGEQQATELEMGIDAIIQDGFVSVHSGVYRVEVQKYVGDAKKAKK